MLNPQNSHYLTGKESAATTQKKPLKHQKLRFSGHPAENWHGNYTVKMVKK